MAPRSGSDRQGRGVFSRVRSLVLGPSFAGNAVAPRSALMRDSASGILGSHRPAVRDTNDEIRSNWTLAAGRAIDNIQNSGWLAGGVDQAIVDTIGTGLRLNAVPDPQALGLKDSAARDLTRLIEKRWWAWASNPVECDARGKRTIDQMANAALRYHFAFGEVAALLPKIARRVSKTRTKALMISPVRLSLETDDMRGLIQGVLLDADGMPRGYRINRTLSGRDSYGRDNWLDISARSLNGRPQVVHVFDGLPDQVRGMTPLAPILLRARQYDQLADATITASLIQTMIAGTIKSEKFGEDAFEGYNPAPDPDGGPMPMPDEVEAHMQAKLAWWSNKSINLGAGARIAHLFPGEEFELHAAQSPHNNYLPFSRDLKREMARCVGVTYEGMTGDHDGSTYSSVRMGVSSIWPVALYRRAVIPTPFYQAVYDAWLEEEVETGAIPLKGGLRTLYGARPYITAAEWHGPAAPTADDYKSAKAARERIDAGLTSLSYEQSQYGLDPETVAEQRAKDVEIFASRGLPNPYERRAPIQQNDPLLADDKAKTTKGAE